jgi:hypothetical protein
MHPKRRLCSVTWQRHLDHLHPGASVRKELWKVVPSSPFDAKQLRSVSGHS